MIKKITLILILTLTSSLIAEKIDKNNKEKKYRNLFNIEKELQTPQNIRLNGIIWDIENPIALFQDNNQTYQKYENQNINGYTIVSIEQHSLLIKIKDHFQEVKIGETLTHVH